MARTRYQAGGQQLPLSMLPAAALRAAVREGYGASDLRSDLLAGVVVGVVALPLAMALAIAVGVPPQLGLYTAIVAGGLIAVFGGSRTQVSGPTAAFIVILQPIVAKFGLAGLLLSGLLGGVVLVTMGLLRLGRLVEFIPHPVTTGFTTGIATVIATIQVKDILGLELASNPQPLYDRLRAYAHALPTFNPWELTIGALTLALLVGLRRVVKRVPAPLVALPVAALVAAALSRFVEGVEITTIASRFQYDAGGGNVLPGVPRLPPLPLLPWNQPGAGGAPFVLTFDMVRELLPSAFAVAMLGAIESLLSAVVADGMAGTRHDPDAELVGQGIGNIVAPFFGGIPATGAIARTATNVRSGARSPVAAIAHALTVLFAVLVLAPALGYLPMAALGALLLLVAWNMAEVKNFATIVRVAPRADMVVLLLCYGLTVFVDMVVAVSVGIMLAALLFMRRMAEVTRVKLHEGTAAGIEGVLPPGVFVYEIAGPLFFGAAQRAMDTLGSVGTRAKVVILRMEQVPVMDATGLVALESALKLLRGQGARAVLTGLAPQPRELIERARLVEDGHVRVAPTIADALASALVSNPSPPDAAVRPATRG